MITIHHLNQSRSFRVVWLMEELGLPYNLVCHQRQPDLHAPASLRAIHALGKAPVIEDDGRLLFESGAIVEYVIHRYGQGRLSVPCHHMGYADYLVWFHAAEGTAMPILRPILYAALGGRAATEAQHDANEAVLRLCDAALSERGYFASSDFTAADIMMYTYGSACERVAKAAFGRYASLGQFLDRVRGRPAFDRAWQVTGPQVDERAASPAG